MRAWCKTWNKINQLRKKIKYGIWNAQTFRRVRQHVVSVFLSLFSFSRTCFDNGEFEVVISAYVSTSFSPVSIELHEIDNNGFSFNRDVVVEYAGDVYNLKGDASRMNITLPAKQGTHVFRATVKGVSWTDAFRLAFSPSLQPTIGQAPNFPIVKIPCHITYEQLLTTQPNQINYDTLRWVKIDYEYYKNICILFNQLDIYMNSK